MLGVELILEPPVIKNRYLGTWFYTMPEGTGFYQYCLLRSGRADAVSNVQGAGGFHDQAEADLFKGTEHH